MASIAKLAKRKKVKKVFSRRAQTGILAAPQKSFGAFNDYIRCEVDKKEIIESIKGFVKTTYSKRDIKLSSYAPESAFYAPHICATIEWKNLGKTFPDGWNDTTALSSFKTGVLKYKKPAELKRETSSGISKNDKVLDSLMCKIENVIDEFYDTKTEYNLYGELVSLGVPVSSAKYIIGYYSRQLEEISELITKKPRDLIEAYSHRTKSQIKRFHKFLSSIISDADSYINASKNSRKTRKPKIKTAQSQIKNLKYMSESNSLRIKSIDPIKIIGANRLFLFNTKYSKLTELVSSSGFEIKGMQILNYDKTISREVKLRKPEEFLPIVLSKMPSFINNRWKELTTKTGSTNGRLNSNTLILRVLSK